MVKVGLITKGGNHFIDETAIAIKNALKNNYDVVKIPGDENLNKNLEKLKPDVVFNNFSGNDSKKEQAYVCSILEMHKIPYTGSGLTAHTLALHKDISKKILTYHGVNTPHFYVTKDIRELQNKKMNYPLIVKPNHEGSSIGIYEDSVVYNITQLKKAVSRIVSLYNQPALIEEFIGGREFTVGIIGNEKPTVLPLIEIKFKGQNDFYTHSVKMKDKIETLTEVEIDKVLENNIKNMVLQAYKALDCKDYARIDVRLDENNKPYVIEINTLPGLIPGYSDFPKAALSAGMDYNILINKILKLCIERSGSRKCLTS